jgi:hypothetical protein
LLKITMLTVSTVSIFVSVLALLPSLAVSIYFERAGILSPTFYALAGMCIGLLVLGLYGLALAWGNSPSDPAQPGDAPVSIASIIAAGAVIVAPAGVTGGLTYWSIAGRTAGA